MQNEAIPALLVTSPNLSANTLTLSPGGSGTLLKILPTGEVEAPSLESASEAGRIFVESIRNHLSSSNKTIALEGVLNGTWQNILICLGCYRDDMPAEAVKAFQGIAQNTREIVSPTAPQDERSLPEVFVETRGDRSFER